MPFPFLPGGAVLALGVLVGAFAGFGIALRLLDRAAGAARESIAQGIVAGLRSWTAPRPVTRAASPASATIGGGGRSRGATFDDGTAAVATERVRRLRGSGRAQSQRP